MTNKKAEAEQLELAHQQLIGFAHGAAGYSIKDLVVAMGLTLGEWCELRNEVTCLDDAQMRELDDHFGA